MCIRSILWWKPDPSPYIQGSICICTTSHGGKPLSDEALRYAEEFLLRLLDEHREPMAPGELLNAAAGQGDLRPSAEHLKVALWSLLGSGAVKRLDNNTLMRGGQDGVPAAPVRAAVAR
jgi:hypothetical protein